MKYYQIKKEVQDFADISKMVTLYLTRVQPDHYTEIQQDAMKFVSKQEAKEYAIAYNIQNYQVVEYNTLKT